MNAASIADRLERTPDALEALVAGLTPDDWRLRPAAGGWSILEVAGHLLDEEVLDFRARVASTLEDPSREWTPIDPQSDVERKRFQDADPAQVLRLFREERAASVAWLRSLAAANWDTAKPHPRFGPIFAGELLASWLAHDARHLAQIAKRLHDVAARAGAPYSVGYAG